MIELHCCRAARCRSMHCREHSTLTVCTAAVSHIECNEVLPRATNCTAIKARALLILCLCPAPHPHVLPLHCRLLRTPLSQPLSPPLSSPSSMPSQRQLSSMPLQLSLPQRHLSLLPRCRWIPSSSMRSSRQQLRHKVQRACST